MNPAKASLLQSTNLVNRVPEFWLIRRSATLTLISMHMNARFPYFIVLFASLCLFARAGDDAKDKEAVGELPGWGTASDPDRDCKFFLAFMYSESDSSLTMHSANRYGTAGE